MAAEVRGSWWPAFVALRRVARSQLTARGSDPVLTDDAGTITRRELWKLVRRRRRELLTDRSEAGAPLVVSTDVTRTVLVEAFAGALARRCVVVVAPRAGDRALRQARATRGGPAGIFFTTSGTTGTSRVARSRRGPRALGQLLGLLGMLPHFRKPVVACLAPASHGHGFSTFLITMALGGHFVAAGADTPLPEHIDVLTGVPTQLHELAREWQGESRVGLVLSGSEALGSRESLSAAFRTRVVDAYGTTETGTLTLDGEPLPGVRIRAGTDGRLHARSPMLGRGTFSSDLGYIRDGRVHVTGRGDGVRVTGGENTNPAAVREWLLAREGVSAVEWQERPDERFGKRLVAVVSSTTSLDGEDLRRAIRHEFGQAATPSAVVVTQTAPPSGRGRGLL